MKNKKNNTKNEAKVVTHSLSIIFFLKSATGGINKLINLFDKRWVNKITRMREL